MAVRSSSPPFGLDPLIAEAKRRMRRRRAFAVALLIALAGVVIGVSFHTLSPNAVPSGIQHTSATAPPPLHEISAGPFMITGTVANGPGSGLWGDGSFGPNRSIVGCFTPRHYSDAFVIENRSSAPVTLLSARDRGLGGVTALAVTQFRLASPSQSGPGTHSTVGGGLAYRGWSAAPTRPVRVPPGRLATVQSNFVFHHCGRLAGGRSGAARRSLVLRYRVDGQVRQRVVPLPTELGFTLVEGPRPRPCAAVPGSVKLISSYTSCAVARHAALACRATAGKINGACTSHNVRWLCERSPGPGFPYFYTCSPAPARLRSHWFRIRWNPPS